MLGHRVGARAGGLAADVEQVGALERQAQAVPDGGVAVQERAAVGERVRRDVDHAHDAVHARTVPRRRLGDSRAVTRGGWIAVVGAAALLYAIAAEARLGYDTAYQLVWGRELLDGHLPQYDVRLAPTPHPLQVLAAAPLSLLGQAADEAMRALSLLSLALLAAALFRVGTLLFCPPVGALAAAVLITRPHLIEMAYLGDADVAAVALAAWAAVLALTRRPTAALALLALAGPPAPGAMAPLDRLRGLALPRT